MQTLSKPTPLTAASGFIQLFRIDAAAIRAELSAGLLQPEAAISPKYLYDSLGSKLFEAICEVSEYYPTRTEAAIVAANLTEIARAAGHGTTLIDLGAGNCAKAARLFESLQPRQYVPIDISVEFMRAAVKQLRERFPQIAMTGVGMDFSGELHLPDQVGRDKRLFFYPGSSIGNFTPHEAEAFLKRLRVACQGIGRCDGGLLIGVDLIKDPLMLEAAYDDALGVTASFNLNALLHVNQALGTDFKVREWQHRARFNAHHSRVEMHLEARTALTVHWDGNTRAFAAGERIHTESSYKYTPRDFIALLERAGFGYACTWTDAQQHFMVCYAQAV